MQLFEPLNIYSTALRQGNLQLAYPHSLTVLKQMYYFLFFRRRSYGPPRHYVLDTYKTPHAVQEPQPIKRLPISPPSIVILLVLTSSSQLPLELPGHGTRWLLNWFKRLADGSHLSPRTVERQYFCSSACPLPFNGETLSPSSARSLPPINHPLQSFLA